MLLLDFVDRQFIHNSPPAPTASFRGKTVIVTGANVGLGKAACHLLVELGASLIILACRSIDKGNAAAQDIQKATSCSAKTLQVWPLDMGSYASVIAFAERANTELSRLDAIIANAGIGSRQFRTIDGDEETIRVNVVSLFLHGLLLLPKLRETAAKHDTYTYLTVVSSELYEIAKFSERKARAGQLFQTLNNEKEANMADRYNVSKLMEILVVKQIGELYPVEATKTIVNSVAPGLCNTTLYREVNHEALALRLVKRIMCRPAEVGARTLVHGACAGPESHGQYVPDCKIKLTKGLTKGEEGHQLQKRMWEELREKLESIKKNVTDLGLPNDFVPHLSNQ